MRVAVALLAAAALAAAAPAGTATYREPVPVLEYHVIGRHVPGAPFALLYLTPAAFDAQVAWLAEHHWHAVTMDAVLNHWLDGAPLPSRPIVLTFDDGYPGDLQYALPALRARNWPGVLNLQIGNLVPRHVRTLIRAGWEIDSHTYTHPDLTAVSRAQLYREVVESRFEIQRLYRVHADVFCYPGGRYDARVVAEVRLAGYRAAETERPGWAAPHDGLLTLDRIRIEPGQSLAAYLRLTSP